jgi:hypothetical protein
MGLNKNTPAFVKPIKKMRTITTVLALSAALLAGSASAQSKPTAAKPRCNPIVMGQIPKKALSLTYEYQTGFDNTYRNNYSLSPLKLQNRFDNVQSVRFNHNRNLIVKPKAYMSMDLGYWYTRLGTGQASVPTAFTRAAGGAEFHSVTLTTNTFFPLDQKHFLLLNVALEFNGNGRSFRNISGDNFFAGGGLFYGWKDGFRSMKAVGVLRAYRFGRVAHVPAFLMNHNFNKKWGLEMLLPARAAVRYSPDAKNFITAGYDLEGGQFAFEAPNSPLDNSFFQRGEIRPRLGYEMALNKNTRLTFNAGVRINGRFDWADNYDGKRLVVENDPDTNLFANVGFHIVNLKTAKKKK